MYLRLSMYLQRYRMIAYTVLTVASVFVATLPVALQDVNGKWVMVRATAERVEQYWQNAMQHDLDTLIVVLLFCAADLGATAMGDDNAQRSLEYVITRPRSRSQLVWIAWFASIIHVIVLAMIGVLTCGAILLVISGTVHFGALFQLLGVVMVTSVAMVSLAYALSVGTGSARNGYLLAALTLVAYTIERYSWMGSELAHWHNAQFAMWRISETRLFDPPRPDLHIVALAVLSVVLPFVASLGFQRREI